MLPAALDPEPVLVLPAIGHGGVFEIERLGGLKLLLTDVGIGQVSPGQVWEA